MATGRHRDGGYFEAAATISQACAVPPGARITRRTGWPTCRVVAPPIRLPPIPGTSATPG